MSESSLFLDDVTVKTKQNLNNETSLITLKNKSINSLDAVSSQSISKSGDGNVASAIKEYPEFQFKMVNMFLLEDWVIGIVKQF